MELTKKQEAAKEAKEVKEEAAAEATEVKEEADNA